MPKHPRKRQKTAKPTSHPRSGKLELLLDDASKDDEERRLESMLFGTEYVSRADVGREMMMGDEVDEEGHENVIQDGGNEMKHLLDTDLFFVDAGIDNLSSPDAQDEDSESDSETSEQDSEESDSEADSQSSSSTTPLKPSKPSHPLSRSHKPPAWTDPADSAASTKVSLLKGHTRLRKLRETRGEDRVSTQEYETRLRRQFERINPEPEWARKARKQRKATGRGGDSEDDSEDDDNRVQNLFSSTAGVLSRKAGKTPVLPTGTLAIERVRDANQAAQDSSGAVHVVAFHPSDKVPVLCVATADRRVRLFNVDGHTSPLLQTLHIPSLPLLSQSSILFHPLGSSILLTGPRPFFYVYDLQSGHTAKHTRGLWGTTFAGVNDPTSSLSSSAKRGHGDKGPERGNTGAESLGVTAFSPNSGDILAVAGRGGYVHLVDWKSSAGQVIGSLKCGGGGGGVQGLWWVPSNGFSEDSVLGAAGGATNSQLAVLSGDAEVYIWDVGQRRCIRKWKDEGGFRGAGRVLAGTTKGGTGGWLSVGSNTGLVNVYGSDSFSVPSSSNVTLDNVQPKPLKTIGNLVTSISTMCYNHDGQILAVASKEKKDAVRMIHLPSLTSFANWPTSSTPLGHVTTIDFSARSEYVAIGNTRGRVLLYHLKDYGYNAIN